MRKSTPGGDDCRQPPGLWQPRINLGRCEGKGACVPACPVQVFVVRPVTVAERATLGPLQRLKLRVHGNRVAEAVRAGDCRACGACIAACPERAITLTQGGSVAP